MTDREAAFKKAQTLSEQEKSDEAMEAIAEFTSEEGAEYSAFEMQVVNAVISEKLTSCAYDNKKDACFQCLTLLEGVKLSKDGYWLELYCDSVYEIFSKLSRFTRDEEREQSWNRLKELYYEITLATKKAWKDKNAPQRLTIYVQYAKLCKSFLDVADEDSFKICEKEAKEAKFVGKGTLEDDDWKDANRSIELIKKTIADALHERELIDDSE